MKLQIVVELASRLWMWTQWLRPLMWSKQQVDGRSQHWLVSQDTSWGFPVANSHSAVENLERLHFCVTDELLHQEQRGTGDTGDTGDTWNTSWVHSNFFCWNINYFLILWYLKLSAFKVVERIVMNTEEDEGHTKRKKRLRVFCSSFQWQRWRTKQHFVNRIENFVINVNMK